MTLPTSHQNQRKYLVSFADRRLIGSLRRLKSQADKARCFDGIFLYTEENLSDSFKLDFGEKLNATIRGFGYWCWKPEAILMALQQLSYDDILLYVDAGCHINPNGLERLNEYFNVLNHSVTGIVGFQVVEPTKADSPLKHDGRKLDEQFNYQWIKRDLFDYFGVSDDLNFTHNNPIGAGIILIRKCNESLSIVREWQSVMKEDFSLLDDSASKSENISGFVEHRHDQAIWSLICLKYNVKTLSAYEYWYPKFNKMKPDWQALKNFPIHARRDKDYGIIGFAKRAANKLCILFVSKFNIKFSQRG